MRDRSRSLTQIHLPHASVFSHVRRGPGGDDLARVEHGHLVAELEHEPGLVLDEDHRHAGGLQRCEEVGRVLDLGRREPGEGLVEDDGARLRRARRGELGELLDAVRDERDPARRPRSRPDERQRPGSRPPELPPVAPRARERLPPRRPRDDVRRPRVEPDSDVLRGRELADEHRRLEGAHEAVSRARRRACALEAGAVELDRPRERRQAARDQVDEGGLARSVRADQRHRFARAGFEVQAAEDHSGAARSREIVDEESYGGRCFHVRKYEGG